MDEDDDDMPVASGSSLRKNAIIEDDEVVKEMDIVVNKKCLHSLYLLQHPAQHSSKIPFGHCQTVQFKQNQHKLRIKCEINTQSQNYDKSRGEQLAINCSGVENTDSEMKFNKLVDHQIFVNDNVGGIHTNCYAIGCYVDGAIHLNPIRHIFQMKPSFFYLDAADEKTKKIALQTSAAANDDVSLSADEDVETVRVKFSHVGGAESEAAKKRRVGSYGYMKKALEEEKWQPLRYRPIEDQDKCTVKDLLVYGEAVSESRQPAQFTSDSKALMRLFVPEAVEEESGTAQPPSDVISLTQIRRLPFPDQVQALMTNVKLIQYRQLITLLPAGAQEDVILNNLQKCAVLVQGCWVVKSDILYPRHFVSPRSGVTGEMLSKIRDLILYKFHQSPTLDKKDITGFVKVHAEDLNEMLRSVARLKYQKGWHFSANADVQFLKNYPDIAKRQADFWEARYQALVNQLNLRQRIRSGQQSASVRIRRTTKSKSGSEIFSGSEDEKCTTKSSSPAKKLRSNSPVKQNVVVAVNSVNHTSNDELLKEELKKFLFDAFSRKPALPLTEIRRLLKLRSAESAPGGSLLKSNLPDQSIDQCAAYLGAKKICISNNPAGPVYVYDKVGSWHEARTILADLLSIKPTITLKTFKQKCISLALEPTPSDADLKSILNEYCTPKNRTTFILNGIT